MNGRNVNIETIKERISWIDTMRDEFFDSHPAFSKSLFDIKAYYCLMVYDKMKEADNERTEK